MLYYCYDYVYDYGIGEYHMVNELVERGYLTQSLGSASHSGEHGFKTVPGLLKLVLEKQAWGERVIIPTQEQFPGQTFEDYIRANPPKGLGTSKETIERLIGNDETLLSAFHAALGLGQRCAYCGKDVPQQAGKREKRYCNNVCKQLAYRKRKNTLPVDGSVDGLQTSSDDVIPELEELRVKVSDQARTIEELRLEIGKLGYHDRLVRQLQDEREALEQERTTLKNRLDYERRYLEDTKAYTFKSWLRKQPSSPWRIKFLSDQLVPPRTSRAGYQAHMKRLNMTDEEMEDFIRLWKLMLSQS